MRYLLYLAAAVLLVLAVLSFAGWLIHDSLADGLALFAAGVLAYVLSGFPAPPASVPGR